MSRYTRVSTVLEFLGFPAFATLSPNVGPWSLFVASKWALVILPFYVTRYFNAAANCFGRSGGGRALPGFPMVRSLAEKLLAHGMFYIGMGIPIIGFDAVFDIPRLVGFTLTNMVIHEALPKLLSEKWFQKSLPEGQQTLGLNIVIDTLPLEFSIRVGRRGKIVACESPFAKVTNVIRRTRAFRDGNGTHLDVELRRFFVPHGLDPHFLISLDRSGGAGRDRRTLGCRLSFDFGDLADFVMPLYYLDGGYRHWLWREQYWTKFFNEIGGCSYVATPFEIIRKSILVILGTPLAFCAGNALMHAACGGALNLAPLVFFNYGVIFTFTVGGMYGASIFSTLIELGAWLSYMIGRKRHQVVALCRSPRFRADLASALAHNPYLDPNRFGVMLQSRSRFYRQLRFLIGGIVMGGLCSWGITDSWGFALDHTLQAAIAAVRDNGRGRTVGGVVASVADYYFYQSRTVGLDDPANRLFSSAPNIAGGSPVVRHCAGTVGGGMPKLTVKGMIRPVLCGVLAICAAVAMTSSANAAGLGNDVIYSIMIDRFSSGNDDDDIPYFAYRGDSDYDRKVRYWLPRMYYKYKAPGDETDRFDINAYWGGDLQGVVNKLDYLHDLGVTVILLSPPFENAKGYDYQLGGTAYHGYWTRDFMRLEPHFVNPPRAGETLDDVLSRGVLLKGLIDKAHSYDPPMRVLLDFPLHHTSPVSITATGDDPVHFLEMGALYDDGTFAAIPCRPQGGKTCKETFTGDGWFTRPEHDIHWNDPSTYYDGWMYGNLANLDQRSPQVRRYLMRAMEKWLALGVDGFRLDAVKYISPEVIHDVIDRLTQQHPGIILIGEYFGGGLFEEGLHYGKVPRVVRWLRDFPRMTIFDFSFSEAARQFFIGRSEAIGTPYFLRDILDADSPENALRSRRPELVTFLNSQDVPRFLSLPGATFAGYAAAMRLMFVSPGLPMLFYGDEIGLAYRDGDGHWQYHDPSDAVWARLPMPWFDFDRPEALAMRELTRSLIRLRRDYPFLRTGRFELLPAANISPWFDKTSYMAVMRSSREAADGCKVFFLYSAVDRDRLEFAVDLPDGRYSSLDGAVAVTVADRRMIWGGIKAQDSLIVVAKSPRDNESRE